MNRALFLLICSIPMFILLFFAWSLFFSYDMNRTLENEYRILSQQITEQPVRMAPLTDQESIIIQDDQELIFTVVDHDTQEIMYKESLESNIFNDLAIAYQENGIALLTKDDVLHASFYKDGKLSTLPLPNVRMNTYLHQRTIVFNGTIYAIVENDSLLSVLAIRNGEIFIQTLEQLTGIADIVDARIVPHSKAPIIEINVYEGDDLFIALDAQPELHVIAIAPDSHEGRFIMDTAINQSPTSIQVVGQKIKLVDTNTMEGSELDIPIFYPKVVPVSADKTVIIGQEDVHREEEIVVRLYQNDGTPLQSFHMQSGDELDVAHRNNTIYVSSSTTAALFQDNQFHAFTWNDFNASSIEEAAEIEQRMKEHAENPTFGSKERFVSLFKNNESFRNVVYTTIGYMMIIIGFIGGICIWSLSKKRRIERAFANGGGKVVGIISNVAQTGSYTNEQPVVRADVLFTFNRKSLKRSIKYTANLISPPQAGDRIEVIYDPMKDKLYRGDYETPDVQM